MFQSEIVGKVRGQENREYRLSFPSDAPIGEVHQAILKLSEIVEKQMEDRREKEEKPEDPVKEQDAKKDEQMVSQKLDDYSMLKVNGTVDQFFEQRIENDGNGNPIYIGYTKKANESTAAETWFIKKISYSGGYPIRVQLPDNGPQFKYAWDDRASLFS